MNKKSSKNAVKIGRHTKVFSTFQGNDSLVHLGIYENDVIHIKPVSSFCEEKLYVWEMPNGERAARYAFDNFGDISLDDRNGVIVRFKPDELTLLGRVVKIERYFEADGEE